MCAAAGYGSGGTCTVNANNLAAIEGLVNLAIAETNQAYQLSNIPTRLRLVKTHYDATFNEKEYGWDAALSLIRNNGDGQLDYVHAMRDQYGADFVSIIVDIGTYCGIGYRPTSPTAGDAFSVVQWSCATGYYSFGHEVAHNMGCNHDRANSGATNSQINYGYQDPDSSFRTIMAYDCKGSCPRVQYFSNPSLNFNGRSLGDKGSDNASWIRKYLAAFANFRPSVNILPFNSNPILSLEPTSSPTVAPTRPPTNEHTFPVDLEGGYVGAEGNMFDIRATTNLYIRNFAVHALAATEVTVEVWKKITLGTCIGTAVYDSDQWQLIGQASFVSNPTGTASPLPEGTIPAVFVKAGDIQAFYITFAAVTNYNRYNAGEELGAIYKANEHLQVFEGYAIWYAFSGYFSPRIWNGVIYYELDTVSNVNPTSSFTSQPSMQGKEFSTTSPVAQPSNIETPTQNIQPIVQPSFSTTNSSPSSQPVIILPPTLQPTPPPTMQPTILPTTQPTMQPTIQPTLEQLPNSISSVTLNPVSRQRITTTFNAKSGQAGNMFEIQASRGLTVTSLDIHTASKSNVTVLVYYKKGTYIGFQSRRNAWTRIVNTTIEGLGSFIPSPIPEKVFSPVPLAAGEIASFYITLTRPQIRYTSYSRLTLLPSDANVRFIRSSGNAYLFGSSYSNKLWNGVLYYSSSVNTV
jgi:Metallo-peptidase family M12B Reprolysin-like